MNRIIILSLLILSSLIISPIYGETAWEGSAIRGTYGEFPESGYYGGSNSFPRNTIVKVTNLENSESVEVIISKNIDEPGIFLTLSEEAADSLQIGRSGIARVRMEPVSKPSVSGIDFGRDMPYHPDPDINPVASVRDPNKEALTQAKEREAKPSEKAVEEEAAEPEIVQEAVPEEVQEDIPEETPKEEDIIAKGEVAEEELPPLVEDPLREEREPLSDRIEGPEIAKDERPLRIKPLPEPSLPEEKKVEAKEPEIVAQKEESPLEDVIDSLAKRSPQKQLYQAPREEDLLSLLDLPYPKDSAKSFKPSQIAEAEAYPEKRPDLSGFAPRTPPKEELIAALEDPSPKFPGQPSVEDLGPIEAPKDGIRVSRLAEAKAPGEEVPESDDIGPVKEPEEALDVELAEADPDKREEPKTAEIPPETEEVEEVYEEIEEIEEPVEEEEGPAEDIEQRLEEDVELVLEPADFKPPPVPEAEEGSLEQRTPEEEETAPEYLVKEPEPEKIDEAVAEEAAPLKEEEELEEIVKSIVEDLGPEIGALGEEVGPEEKSTPAEKAPPAEEAPVAPELRPEEFPDAPNLSWAKNNLPIVSSLERQAYYLQLGAYENPKIAQLAIRDIAGDYPQVVQPIAKADETMYRVFVGPLNEDESGVILYRFRAQGFRDAFIRRGGE